MCVCVQWLTPCFHKGRPDISILVGDKPVRVSVEWFSNKKGIWTLLLPSSHILLVFSSSLHPPWRIPLDIPSRSKPHLSSADTVKGTATCRDWGGNGHISLTSPHRPWALWLTFGWEGQQQLLSWLPQCELPLAYTLRPKYWISSDSNVHLLLFNLRPAYYKLVTSPAYGQ